MHRRPFALASLYAALFATALLPTAAPAQAALDEVMAKKLTGKVVGVTRGAKEDQELTKIAPSNSNANSRPVSGNGSVRVFRPPAKIAPMRSRSRSSSRADIATSVAGCRTDVSPTQRCVSRF